MKLKLLLSLSVVLFFMSLGCEKASDSSDNSNFSGFIGNWKGQITRVDSLNSTTLTDVSLTFSSPSLLVYNENNIYQNYFWESDIDKKILTLLLHQTIGTGQVSQPLVDFPKHTYLFSDMNNHLEFWHETQIGAYDIKYILDRQ